ncbi:MAG: alpha/beta fold hydrolase [Actinomycetota bacterium]
MADPAFVLVHSPLAGPSTWAPVAEALAAKGRRAIVPVLRPGEVAGGPFRVQLAEQVAEAVTGVGSVILVGHSGAGLLLPAIGEELTVEVEGTVFVDATIPARTGATPVVAPEFMHAVRQMATEGLVPKWSAWWPEDVMRTLIPDDGLRQMVEDELPSLPLAYFEEVVPTPAGWTAQGCSYLQFSEPYLPTAAEAEARGWPVGRLPGGHLHMLVDPGQVTKTLLMLAANDH